MSTGVEFHCPFCKAHNRAEMWLRIEAAEDPALVQQAMDGALFTHTCWSCKEAATFDHALLFVDTARRVWFLNQPPSDPLAEHLAPAEMDNPPNDFQLRRVSNTNAFQELLRVWQDGLDDGAMLLLKHMLAARVLQDTGEPPILCSYDVRVTHDRQEWLEYVVFANEESEPETLAVPLSTYESVRQTISPYTAALFPVGQWIDWNDETARTIWETVQGNS